MEKIDCTPIKAMLIVKYGGSAITDKATLETLKSQDLEKAAHHLCQIHNSDIWSQIIVVHGAGSFGHFQAREFGLKNGRTSVTNNSNNNNAELSWKRGTALTRHSVQQLNHHVVGAHIKAGLSAVGLSPFPTVITGHIAEGETSISATINPLGSSVQEAGVLDSVANVLSSGLLPVLHGDVVLDRHQACAILGGDHIIAWLCQQQYRLWNLIAATTSNSNSNGSCSYLLNSPQHEQTTQHRRMRVVFLTDVVGVYDRAPYLPGATLIRRITVRTDGTTDLHAHTETAAHDVTGGIEAKLQVAFEIARQSRHVDVVIVQIGSISALQALEGKEPDFGTTISLNREE